MGGDEHEAGEEFFQFPTGGAKRSSPEKLPSKADSNNLDFDMTDAGSHDLLEHVQLDDMFGKVFGIERVHLLHNSDRLQDVIEKVQLIPENKLVYVETNHEREEDASFKVYNALTLADLMQYLCPTTDENA